jgi:DNA-binding NarL/FixJ family response regulator
LAAPVEDVMQRKVFISDDQQRFLDEFLRKHKDHYEIVGHLGSTRLLDAISATERLPDIVVLDLYYPRDDTEPFF